MDKDNTLDALIAGVDYNIFGIDFGNTSTNSFLALLKEELGASKSSITPDMIKKINSFLSMIALEDGFIPWIYAALTEEQNAGILRMVKSNFPKSYGQLAMEVNASE